jgi:hypothetical protein
MVSIFHFVNFTYPTYLSHENTYISQKIYGELKKYKKHILKTFLYSDDDGKTSIVMRSDDLNSVIRPTSLIINRRTF